MRRGPHLGASQAIGQGVDTRGPLVTPLQEEPKDSSAQPTAGYEIKSAAHVQFKNMKEARAQTSLGLTGTKGGVLFHRTRFNFYRCTYMFLTQTCFLPGGPAQRSLHQRSQGIRILPAPAGCPLPAATPQSRQVCPRPWPLLGKPGGHSAVLASCPGLFPLSPSCLLLKSTFQG